MSAVELIVDGSMAELIMKRLRCSTALMNRPSKKCREHCGRQKRAEFAACYCEGRVEGSLPDASLHGISPYRRCVRDFVGGVQPLIAQLRNLPIPTVAAVHGPCLGVGFGLAMACDVVLAA